MQSKEIIMQKHQEFFNIYDFPGNTFEAPQVLKKPSNLKTLLKKKTSKQKQGKIKKNGSLWGFLLARDTLDKLSSAVQLFVHSDEQT